MRYRPKLETLERRDLAAVAPLLVTVGPGKEYADLWQVPVRQNEEVDLYWQPTPYRDKLDINVSNFAIKGIAGPDGQRPVIDAKHAVENIDASYYFSQTTAQGLITVEPSADSHGQAVDQVLIEEVDLENAGTHVKFTAADGSRSHFSYGADGIALYLAQNVTIEDCAIHGNDQGVFGKSYGYAGGDLVNVSLIGNAIWDNGMVGDNHHHNTYIEGWYTAYIGNSYGPLKDGSAGTGLKDRSVAPVIAYNTIEGGSYLLDLVDPDDGAADMVATPDYGTAWVYGNTLVNPAGNNTHDLVYFGFDQLWADAQQTLYFVGNRVIDATDRSGHYYTVALELVGGPTAYVAGNTFTQTAPNPSSFYLASQAYGDSTVYLGKNALPAGTILGDYGVTVYRLNWAAFATWVEDHRA